MALNWNSLDHFKRREFDDPDVPGSGDFIDEDILSSIVRLRNFTGWPILIVSAVDMHGRNHAKNSYHNKSRGCRAVDFRFICSVPYNNQLETILKFGAFKGIGWYPEWHLPGFHVDNRSEFLLWKRIEGEYIYLP